MERKRFKMLLAIGIILSLAAFAVVEFLNSSTDVLAFGKEQQSAFLLYAHLSNRVLWIQNGTTHAIDGKDMKMPSYHHSYPAISSDGDLVAFVRSSTEASAEQIVLFNTASREESVLLKWPGAVWATSWSPSHTELAFIADKPSADRQQSLYVVDMQTHQVTDLTPDVKWVSDYSSPSWSPNGNRIAFERRFTDDNGNQTRTVMLVDLNTKTLTKVADGFFPSWSPPGDKLAYISPDGRECYQVMLGSNEKQLLFSYRNLTGQDIAGPVIWAPSGKGMLFNTTSGIEGDGRKSYYVDLLSRKKSQINHDPNFEIVGWSSPGGHQAAL